MAFVKQTRAFVKQTRAFVKQTRAFVRQARAFVRQKNGLELQAQAPHAYITYTTKPAGGSSSRTACIF
jgi:hypothetical protein